MSAGNKRNRRNISKRLSAKRLVPTGKSRSQRNCQKKVRYTSERKAKEIIHKLRFEDNPPKRAYPCPHCGGWHLTSRA